MVKYETYLVDLCKQNPNIANIGSGRECLSLLSSLDLDSYLPEEDVVLAHCIDKKVIWCLASWTYYKPAFRTYWKYFFGRPKDGYSEGRVTREASCSNSVEGKLLCKDPGARKCSALLYSSCSVARPPRNQQTFRSGSRLEFASQAVKGEFVSERQIVTVFPWLFREKANRSTDMTASPQSSCWLAVEYMCASLVFPGRFRDSGNSILIMM